MKKIDLSIAAPFFNEEKNVSIFFEELFSYIENSKYINNYEIIAINDGSIDNTKNQLSLSKQKYNNFSIIDLKKNMGQSNAINTAVINSKYNYILTIDTDCQNDPKDIDKLIFCLLNDFTLDLVAGERIKRKDNFIKKLSSKIANFIRNLILHDGCKDTGCSLKLFKKNIFLEFRYFDGIHRFIPSLFVGYGHKAHYVRVNHRYRMHGQSKYGTLKRLIKGIMNLYYVYNQIHLKKKNNG